MSAHEQSPNVGRFFLHYPEGHRAYIVIVDSQRRAFDFSDNTFKFAKKLASPRDACLYATGKHEERADHHHSYGVEFDLARLTAGASSAAPAEGAAVKVHWLVQVGDEPDVSVDTRMPRTCELHCVNGRFEPKNQWDREALDESLAFAKREKSGEEYRAFVLEEIEQREALWKRFDAAVEAGDVARQIRILAEDLCLWAKNLKPHLIHHVSHCATDPMFVRMADVPGDAPFEFLDTWIMREWMGRIEVRDALEFHKGVEYADSFAERFEPLFEARLKFARLVVRYTVQHRGEDALGMISLDEIRKGIKGQALSLVDYLDRLAGLLGPTCARETLADVQADDGERAEAMSQNAVGSTVRTEGTLEQFAGALGTYTSLVNEIILEANHSEIESFEDAINWTTKRQSHLKCAYENVERLAGTKLVAEIVPPVGVNSEQWVVQLLAKVAESQHAISFVFTSGPPKARSDDPRAVMAANVVSKQIEIASNLIREIDSCCRMILATAQARRKTKSADAPVVHRAGAVVAAGAADTSTMPETELANAGASNDRTGLLIVDQERFEITWNGNGPHHLGNTKAFHLLHQLWLARGKYVEHGTLAERIGGDENDTVTHVKSRLVKVLKDLGLQELAGLIRKQTGYYGLFIS